MWPADLYNDAWGCHIPCWDTWPVPIQTRAGVQLHPATRTWAALDAGVLTDSGKANLHLAADHNGRPLQLMRGWPCYEIVISRLWAIGGLFPVETAGQLEKSLGIVWSLCLLPAALLAVKHRLAMLSLEIFCNIPVRNASL